jgi:RNA polymerase primary sigma factor/RNA polymerase sigma factor
MTITATNRFDLATIPPSAVGRKRKTRAGRERAARIQRLRDRNWQYIHAPGFDEAESDAAGEFCFDRTDESAPRAGRNADFYVAFLYNTVLLTREEEGRLFWRMNFCKFRAGQLAKRLDPQRATDAQVRRVESLARAALEIRDRLVESNLRLVTSQARRFADSTGLPMDELISEGHVALLNAVDKFDHSRGNKFSTYATTAIHHQMVACLHRVRRDGERMSYQQGEMLDAETGDDRSVESQAYVAEVGKLLGSMIGRLDERERYIVQSRFGISAGKELKTIKSIAEDFGVTKQRVQQLQVRALNKLREMVTDVGICDADGGVA